MLLDITLEHVKKLADGLQEPDEDVLPVVIIETPVKVDVLSVSYQDDTEKKDFFFTMLPMIVVVNEATVVIHVTMAWFSVVPVTSDMKANPTTYKPEVMPRNDPKRKEMLIVSQVTADSVLTYMAKVVRSKNMPPMIEDLKLMEGAVNNLLERTQKALKFVASSQ